MLGAALEEEALPEQGLRGPPALPAPQGAAQEVAIQEVRAAAARGAAAAIKVRRDPALLAALALCSSVNHLLKRSQLKTMFLLPLPCRSNSKHPGNTNRCSLCHQ